MTIKLEYIGRQGFCRYYWRLFKDGTKILYAKPDYGRLGAVAGCYTESSNKGLLND